jgi:hypothetical protein
LHRCYSPIEGEDVSGERYGPSYQGDLSEAEKKLSSVWNASSPDLGPSHGYQLAELDYLAAAGLDAHQLAAAILRQLGGGVQIGPGGELSSQDVEDDQPGRVRVVGGEYVLRVLDGGGVRGGELDRYQPVVEVAAGALGVAGEVGGRAGVR